MGGRVDSSLSDGEGANARLLYEEAVGPHLKVDLK
jgi:hypothetical protein